MGMATDMTWTMIWAVVSRVGWGAWVGVGANSTPHGMQTPLPSLANTCAKLTSFYLPFFVYTNNSRT